MDSDLPKASHSDRQRSLLLLKAEESRLLGLLSSVRTNINSLLPISTLPNEVLEAIFGICVSWLYGYQKPKYRLAWTQVCQGWRHISLNSARLWQYIDLCDSRLAHEFLIRSGTAPISIISASPLRLCTDNLEPHATRLQSIDVFLFPDDMEDLFGSMGSNLANLASLSLKIPPISGNFRPHNFAQAPLPQLTKLSLDGVSVPWHTCHALTHLSLRGLSTEHCPSLEEFHSILTSSPRIEYLRLENISPSPLHHDPAPVHLSDLHTFILSNKAPVTYALLSLITMPHTTRVQLSCPSFTSLPTIIPLPFPWQDPTSEHGLTRAPDIPTLRLGRHTLHLIQDPRCESAQLTPWTESPTSFCLTLTLSSPASTSTSSTPGSNTLPTRVLPHLHTLLPALATSLTSLELGMAALTEIPSPLLVDFLVQTPNVESILIAFNDQLEDLLLALMPGDPDAASNPPSILCPKLRRLSFGSPACGYVWYNFYALWFTSVAQLAAARHAAGVPLNSMEFRACQGVEENDVREAFEMGGGRRGWLEEVHVTEPETCPQRWGSGKSLNMGRREHLF